jgi:hypothetical protein
MHGPTLFLFSSINPLDNCPATHVVRAVKVNGFIFISFFNEKQEPDQRKVPDTNFIRNQLAQFQIELTE